RARATARQDREKGGPKAERGPISERGRGARRRKRRTSGLRVVIETKAAAEPGSNLGVPCPPTLCLPPPQMTVHNLYLFDRNGVCLHYSEWNRKKQAGISKEETSKYKLHYYETPSGLKVVMNTDLGVGNIQEILHQIYSYIYVEYVVKNPLCGLNESIQSELFRNKLDSFVRSLPFFSARAG
ncbi:hypothetical protein E2320_003655, partial [Naja naja]